MNLLSLSFLMSSELVVILLFSQLDMLQLIMYGLYCIFELPSSAIVTSVAVWVDNILVSTGCLLSLNS